MTSSHGFIMSVSEEIVGDFVATAATATDTTLVVDDLSPFDEEGGTILIVDEDTADETVDYDGFDEDTETLNLASPLAQNHDVGTPVRFSPEQLNRVAYVQLDDPDLEPIPARVPFSLKDRVPVGLRSLVVGDADEAGDYELPEEVLIDLDRGGWVLTDVLRKDVTISASDITNAENGFLLSTDGVFLPARPIGSYWIYDDFTNTAGSGQANGVAQTQSGTGANWAAGTAELSRPGVWQGDTGTTTSGRAGLTSADGAFLLGGGAMRLGAWLKVGSLSTGGERYNLSFGFWDTTTYSTANNSVNLSYQDNLQSGEWYAQTQATGSAVTATGIPAVSATWYHLEIAVNDDASQVDFYVDKVLVVSHTTFIPTASMELRMQIEKISGTTARKFSVDAYYINGLLDPPR